MSELGFNVPPTTRSYGDGTSVESLIRKTGEAGDRSCDPWIGSLACYPLHHRRSSMIQTKNLQPISQQIMLETWQTWFPALFIYPRVGISLSESETLYRFYLSLCFGQVHFQYKGLAGLFLSYFYLYFFRISSIKCKKKKKMYLHCLQSPLL